MPEAFIQVQSKGDAAGRGVSGAPSELLTHRTRGLLPKKQPGEAGGGRGGFRTSGSPSAEVCTLPGLSAMQQMTGIQVVVSKPKEVSQEEQTLVPFQVS